MAYEPKVPPFYGRFVYNNFLHKIWSWRYGDYAQLLNHYRFSQYELKHYKLKSEKLMERLNEQAPNDIKELWRNNSRRDEAKALRMENARKGIMDISLDDLEDEDRH